MSLPDKKRRVRRAWITFGAAVILGPAIGGLIVVLVLLAGAIAGEKSAFSVGLLLQTALMGSLAGYVFGFISALIGGAGTAFFALSAGGLSWARVSFCAAIGGFFGAAIMSVGFDGRLSGTFLIGMTALSVLTATILWFAFRRYVRNGPGQQNSATTP